MCAARLIRRFLFAVGARRVTAVGRARPPAVRHIVLGGTLATVVALTITLSGPTAVTAQPPPPATATPGGPTAPAPDVAGRWSITRTWLRRCPECYTTVTRTTPWEISQQGVEVEVDRGPRGQLVQASDGQWYLNLSGLETAGGAVLRFHYGSLRVSADGSTLEGGFSGSERVQNPCASQPPTVTCFASGGYVRGTRVEPPPATVPAPPGPPTAAPTVPPLPTPMPLDTPTPAPPATATSAQTASATPTATATPTGGATPFAQPDALPPRTLWLPRALR